MIEISKIVKKIMLLHSTNTETPTSFALAEGIISCIPINWKNPNLKILDPACGRGTFLLAVMSVLEKAGHDRKHIIENMLYGVDRNKVQAMIAKKAFNLACPEAEVNIYCEDSLTKVWNMKFDVAVGNPPFQGNNEVDCNRTQPKNHNLWTKFIHKCFSDLVKDDGYVAFVTPDSWMSPSNKIFQLFKEYQLLQVDLECSKYFNVGSSFTAWVAQKSPVTKETVLGTVSVNLKDFPYLPRNVEQTLGIHKKVISSSNARMPVVGDTTCHSSKEVVALQQCDHFCYPLLHTNAQERYSKIKSKYFDHIKVMWTLSGNYIPHIDLGVKGFTEVNQAIIAKDETQANNILSIMNSDLYRFIVTTAKWSGFLNGKVFTMLPKLDFDKSWSNDEIYTEFGLTLEEIAIVEANI
jgi:hypothetical protein